MRKRVGFPGVTIQHSKEIVQLATLHRGWRDRQRLVDLQRDSVYRRIAMNKPKLLDIALTSPEVAGGTFTSPTLASRLLLEYRLRLRNWTDIAIKGPVKKAIAIGNPRPIVLGLVLTRNVASATIISTMAPSRLETVRKNSGNLRQIPIDIHEPHLRSNSVGKQKIGVTRKQSRIPCHSPVYDAHPTLASHLTTPALSDVRIILLHVCIESSQATPPSTSRRETRLKHRLRTTLLVLHAQGLR